MSDPTDRNERLIELAVRARHAGLDRDPAGFRSAMGALSELAVAERIAPIPEPIFGEFADLLVRYADDLSSRNRAEAGLAVLRQLMAARRLREEKPPVAVERREQSSLALLLSAAQRHPAAMPELDRAIQLWGGEMSEVVANLRRARAETLAALWSRGTQEGGRDAFLDRQSGDYAAAARLFTLIGNDRRAAHAWYFAGRTKADRHFVDREPDGLRIAAEYLSHCEQLHTADWNLPALGPVRGALGALQYQLGETDRAQRTMRAAAWAMSRSGQLHGAAQALLAASRFQLDIFSAEAPAATERAPNFMVTYKRALLAWARMHRESFDSTRRLAEGQDASYLRHLVVKQLELPALSAAITRLRDDNIWMTEQLTKARDLLDDVTIREFADGPAVLEMQRRLGRAREERDQLETPQPGDVAARARYRTMRSKLDEEVAGAEKALSHAWKETLSRAEASKELFAPQIVTVSELAAALLPDEVYVGLLWNGGDPVRLTVTKVGGLDVTRCLPPNSDFVHFYDWVRGAVAGARNPSLGVPTDPYAEALLGDLPAGRRILVCPDGEIGSVPWHAMTYSGDRLDAGREVAVIPSASLLVWQRRHPQFDTPIPYLGIACNGDGTIPLVDEEVRETAGSYFRGAPYATTGKPAALEELRGRYGLLHIACHADRGSLELVPGRKTRPPDLLTAGVRAEVLLLSGCETGRFEFEETNRFEGVVRALLIATGAKAAVISAAKVPDVVGLVFADLVVARLSGQASRLTQRPAREPVTVGEAVRLARRDLRDLPSLVSSPRMVELLTRRGTAAQLPDLTADWGLPWYVLGDPSAKLPS